MEYSKENESNYLGSSQDMTGKKVNGFLDNGYIHIVYNLNTPEEHYSTKLLEDIEVDMDKYLWTPYATFASRIPKNKEILSKI